MKNESLIIIPVFRNKLPVSGIPPTDKHCTGGYKQQGEIRNALKFAVLDYTKEDAISYMNTHNHVRRLLKWRDMRIELYI
jgi:hypothetical protein